MKNLENLNSIFNIEPSLEKEDTNTYLPEIVDSKKHVDMENDYQLARQTMRKLIIKGEDTLEELINLAKNSEHPRTYEVAGQFIKQLSDVSKDLLGLQKQIKDIEGPQSSQQIGTQNNVVFAGSTHELMKLLGKKDDSNTIDQ